MLIEVEDGSRYDFLVEDGKHHITVVFPDNFNKEIALKCMREFAKIVCSKVQDKGE